MNYLEFKKQLKDNRFIQAMVLILAIYILVLLYLLIMSFIPQPQNDFQFHHSTLAERPVSKPSEKTAKQKKVIKGAVFDSDGFPIRSSDDYFKMRKGILLGDKKVLAFLKRRMGNTSPEKIFQTFQTHFGRYWKDPNSANFTARSREMATKITKMATRNQQLMTSMVRFLKSPAGEKTAANLKENIVKAIESPGREAMKSGFNSWQKGKIERAIRFFKQADAADPESSYIQVIAHQSLAFLNMEKHGPLEETMRQYRDLAQESHRYISSFKPVLEKAGFDPVKLYGRDPFDASGLPSRAQFEQAMNNSPYVQFERDYYKKHAESPGKSLDNFKPENMRLLKKRQRAGEKR